MKFIFYVSLLLLSLSLSAQDTIRLENKIQYSSEEYPVRGKAFVAQLKYAREDIIFSNTKRSVEYCYYYDSERYCHGNTFEIINENMLLVNDVEWEYFQTDKNEFRIKREQENVTELGQAKSILPFEPDGIFYTISNTTGDTLWQEDYSQYEPGNPFSKPRFCYFNTEVEGKLYEYYQVTTPPSKIDFTSLPTVEIDLEYCYSQPMIDVGSFICTVTSEGKIVNIEQAIGGLEKSCPYTIKEIISQIAGWGIVNPATCKGRKVNARWFVSIDHDRRGTIHPVYSDTVKNRKRIITLKKKGKLKPCD